MYTKETGDKVGVPPASREEFVTCVFWVSFAIDVMSTTQKAGVLFWLRETSMIGIVHSVYKT